MAKVIPPNRKRNVLWPVSRRGKGLVTGVLAKRYESAIRSLLKTPYGSIIWAPTFGSRMSLIRTQSLTEEIIDNEKGLLHSSITIWIPDIQVLQIDFNRNPGDENLDVDVAWGIPDASSFSGQANQPRFAFGPVNTTVTI